MMDDGRWPGQSVVVSKRRSSRPDGDLIKPWSKKIAASPALSGALQSERGSAQAGWDGMEPMMRRCVCA